MMQPSIALPSRDIFSSRLLLHSYKNSGVEATRWTAINELEERIKDVHYEGSRDDCLRYWLSPAAGHGRKNASDHCDIPLVTCEDRNPFLHNFQNISVYQKDLEPTTPPPLSPPPYLTHFGSKTASPSSPRSLPSHLASATSVQRLCHTSAIELDRPPITPPAQCPGGFPYTKVAEYLPDTTSPAISFHSFIKLPPISQILHSLKNDIPDSRGEEKVAGASSLLTEQSSSVRTVESDMISLATQTLTNDTSSHRRLDEGQNSPHYTLSKGSPQIRLPSISALMAGVPNAEPFDRYIKPEYPMPMHDVAPFEPRPRSLPLLPTLITTDRTTSRYASLTSFTLPARYSLSSNSSSNGGNMISPADSIGGRTAQFYTHPHSLSRSGSGSRRTIMTEGEKRARKAQQQQHRRKYGPTREARERFSKAEDQWLIAQKRKLEEEPNKHWTDLENAHKQNFPEKSFRTLSGLQSRYYRIKKRFDAAAGEGSSRDNDRDTEPPHRWDDGCAIYSPGADSENEDDMELDDPEILSDGDMKEESAAEGRAKDQKAQEGCQTLHMESNQVNDPLRHAKGR